MPVDFDYYSKEILTLDELKYIEKIIIENYSNYDCPDSENDQYLYLHDLSKEKLCNLKELGSLSDFSLKCHLDHSGELWTEISKIIGQYKQCQEISEYTSLIVSIGFEEKSSKQSLDGYDSASIRLEKNRSYLYYTGNGSRISIDKEYAKGAFSTFVQALELPLELEIKEEYFKIKALRGDLRLTGSELFGKNPSGFACELFELSSQNLTAKLKAAFEVMSDGKVFQCDWRIFPYIVEGGLYKDNLFELFGVIRNQPWLKGLYDLDLDVKITSITELDAFRSFLNCKDTIYFDFIGFQMRDDLEVGVKVIATKKGHRIMISLTPCESPDDIASELGGLLNLTFREVLS